MDIPTIIIPSILILSSSESGDPLNTSNGSREGKESPFLSANYANFYSRVQRSYPDLTALGINYGIESKVYNYKTFYDNNKNEFTVTLNSIQKKAQIRYTTDGSEPSPGSLLYQAPIIIAKPLSLKVASFYDNHMTGSYNNLSFVFHKAINSKITITGLYADRYSGGGMQALTDGIRGTTNFHDGLWQGYEGIDFEGVIDLDTEKEINRVSTTFLSDVESWIFLPEYVEISISLDNISYGNIVTINNSVPLTERTVFIKEYAASFSGGKARYIKVKAVSIKKCPSWHTGAGKDAWLFIDEIAVE